MVESYDIELGLDAPTEECFRSRTVIRFSGEQRATFADLAATSVESAVLNGRPLTIPEVWDGVRLELTGFDAANVLEVEGRFPYAIEERGLRRAKDPDGTTYLYCAAHPTSASRVFCCFDDPELRAPVGLTVSAPAGWSSLVADTAQPIGPSVVGCATGTWSRLHQLTVRSTGSTVPLAVYAQRSRAGEQSIGREVADLMARSIALYERQLGVPYPYRKCEAVFLRDFVSLGFSTPGLIMLNDTLFELIAARGPQYAATVISHEVAHAWIGDLVDFSDAQWLVEGCATYLSRYAALDLVPGSQPWHISDPAPPDAGRYAADAELIRDLELIIGRDNVLRGLGAFCRRYAHRSAGRADLVACWSEAGGRDLSTWPADRQTS